MSVLNPLCTAHRLIKGGGVGDADVKTFIHDGNNEGKETYVLDGAYVYARLCDAIDPTSIKEISMIYQGVELTLTAKDVTFGGVGDSYVIAYGGNYGVFILGENNTSGVSAGTYVISMPTIQTFVTRLSFEIVDRISSKYLPGACLPVVEISTSQDVDMNAFENDRLNAAWETGNPCVVTISDLLYDYSGVSLGKTTMIAIRAESDGARVFLMSIGNVVFKIESVDNASWVWSILRH